MQARKADGSAGDANYGVIGQSYSLYRQPEPRIAGAIMDGCSLRLIVSRP